MGPLRRGLLLAVLVCLRAAVSPAQQAQAPPMANPGRGTDTYEFIPTVWVVSGRVSTLDGVPVRGARVAVAPSSGSAYRMLSTDNSGEFRTEYSMNARLFRELSVILSVNKKGFLPASRVVDLGDPGKPWLIPVTLRDPKPDPTLLSQATLISALAPRLRKLGAAEGLSAKEEKEYARGVEEFLDKKRADRSLPNFTRVLSRDVSCLSCRTMRALAELESGDWDGAYRDLADVITQSRADPKTARAEPLLAMGVMESWRHQPERAYGFLAEALKAAPGDALVLQEAGRQELLRRECELAAIHLSKAVEAGAGPEARFLHVEALVGKGDLDEAEKGLTHYLAGRDIKTMPPAVRDLWTRLRERRKAEAAYTKAVSGGHATLDYLRRPPVELQGLEPAADQKLLEPILAGVGKNVYEFFRNFPNTSSVEEIHQEKLGRDTKVQETLNSRTEYLCLIPQGTWGPGFDEYRAKAVGAYSEGKGLQQGFMLTSGFASVSLVFHPLYQAQTTFRYLGRQKIRSRDAYVVAFAQRPAQARVNGSFRSGKITVSTFSQGLAWIDSNTYQILRMHTDLLTPVADVRLDQLTTEIDYDEVHFNRLTEGFWLPQEVKVTVAWAGKGLRNMHRYSEYKLFSVDATQKLGQPKTPPPAPEGASDPPPL